MRQLSQDIWTRPVEVCCQTFDDDITLHMISNVYDLDNIWTSDKKCLKILYPTPPCYSNVTLIGFQSVHFPYDVRYCTQERKDL